MNAPSNLPAERKPQIVAGAPVAALVPQTLEEAFRLSGALAASGLAPRGIDKPEQIMVAIMAGAELGLAPFQAVQSFAVVNGRPTLWGDGLVAVVRARGVRIKEWTEGEGDRRVAYCTVTRPDTGEEITRSFSVDDAKKAGLWGKQGPWQQYPQRMLPMRARAWALRDGCADMLRGIQIREEVEDYSHAREVSAPKGSGLAARLNGPTTDEGFTAANAAPDEPVEFAPHAAEIADAEFSDPAADQPEEINTAPSEPVAELADADFDPMDWAAEFTRSLSTLQTVEEVQQTWSQAKADGKVFKLQAQNRPAAEDLVRAVNERAAELKQASEE